MEPAYGTFDPGLLYMTDVGLAMPADPDTVQYTPAPSGFDVPAIPGGVVDFITGAIKTVTAQLPGIIGGGSQHPYPPAVPVPSAAPVAFPLVPLLIVGGIAYFLFRGK